MLRNMLPDFLLVLFTWLLSDKPGWFKLLITRSNCIYWIKKISCFQFGFDRFPAAIDSEIFMLPSFKYST